MRHSLMSSIAILAAISVFGSLHTSCVTGITFKAIDDSTYDGTADSMDSLPDCIPELEGSSFWVREKKGAFDCTAAGEWKNRQSAKKPEDADEQPGAWMPRMIEK